MFGFWRQLRWRIFAANMLVVFVGVAAVLFMAFVATRYVVPQSIDQGLTELARISTSEANPEEVEAAKSDVIFVFRRAIGTSVLIAATGAMLVGLLASLLLVREILRPLTQIAVSSKRIANGHYDERVTIPASDELAQVATNFNDMAEALARVEETRITLIDDVSHELRTPLTSLAGYLEGILDGLFPANKETVALMNREVRRMRRLVDDLQTLSRVEAGQLSLRLTYCELGKQVEAMVAQLQPQWQVRSIQVVMDLPEEPVEIVADSDRVAQILLNLLGNAIGYTPDGGKILVQLTKDTRSALVSVRDTGIGFTEVQRAYLFERFYRGDPSRSRSSGGSGIGLTISRHLAWAMGGELSATSRGPGKGSTFLLTLPLAMKSG